MKQAVNHALLASIVLFLFLFISQRFLFSAFVFCLFFYSMRTKDHTWLLVMLLLACTLIPRYDMHKPSIHGGTIVAISSGSCTVASGRTRILLRTETRLPPDAEIQFDGKYEKIRSSSHFFRMDYDRISASRGIAWSITPSEIRIVHQKPTFRYFLYKKIDAVGNVQLQNLAFRILLGVNYDKTNDSFLYRCGFALSGILGLFETVLSRFLGEKKRNRILLFVNIALFVLYHYPLILFQSLVFRILKYADLRQDERTGVGFIVIMFVYPESIYSAAFLLPAVYRLFSLEKEHRRVKCFTAMSLVQMYLFQGFNPVISLLFGRLRQILGLFWCIGLVGIVFHLPGLFWIPYWFDRWFAFADRFYLYGSCLGFGALFYVLTVFSLRKNKHGAVLAAVFLIVFQIGGFFHPFAELSVINVGQGDSIFLKEPCSHSGVLIDTGKPNQYQTVNTFLHAKGMNSLKALVITHSDNDHSGSQQEIADAYHPKTIAVSHIGKMKAGRLVFYDLNDIVNPDDENESSIVMYTKLNGMKILLMGDADEKTEKHILQKYGNLKCDVLKLSHHGSKTGSCEDFLNAVQPDLGLISSGAYRIYHHPSPETIQRLLARHIPYLDTKTEGDITIVCLPWCNLLITSSGKIGIMNIDE